MRHKLILSLAILVLCSASQAWAYTTVTGECTSGDIAGPAEIKMLDAKIESLRETIIYVGATLDETLKQNQTMQNAQEDQTRKTIEVVVKKMMEAQHALDQKEKYDNSATRAPCDEFDVDAYKISVDQAIEKITESIAKGSELYAQGFNDKEERESFISLIDRKLVDFNPEKTVLTADELKETNKALNILVEPVPMLNRNAADFPNRQAYIAFEAERTSRLIKLKMVREVWSRHLALHAPTIKNQRVLSAVDDLYKSYGGETDAPLKNKDGHMSAWGLLKFSSDLRFASPNWKNDVQNKSEYFLWREQVVMQALQVKLDFEQLREEQAQSALLAQIVSYLENEKSVAKAKSLTFKEQ